MEFPRVSLVVFFLFFFFFFGKDFNTMIEISLSRFIYKFRLVYLVFFLPGARRIFISGLIKLGILRRIS